VLSAVEQREFSEPYHHFVEICLSKAPSLRPNPARLLNHTFFKQCRRGHHSLASVLAPYLSNQPAAAINHGAKFNDLMEMEIYLFFWCVSDLLTDMTAERISDIQLDSVQWNF
jgi:hypothetical protein